MQFYLILVSPGRSVIAAKLYNAVCQVYHKDMSLYDTLISHNVSEHQFISIYINSGYILKDNRIIAFFLYSCKTHNSHLRRSVVSYYCVILKFKITVHSNRSYFISSLTSVSASPRRMLPFWKSATASLIVLAELASPIFSRLSAIWSSSAA